MNNSSPDQAGESITLHELLERSARSGLDLQREDGSFPPGRNGVYDEEETPVRTTAHWLTTLSRVYEITDDNRFEEAANAAADYLLSDEARPYGYTFHSRNVDGKDQCDGLVGQSPAIRGLARAGRTLHRPELTETAAEVFLLHPFEDRIGLWEGVEITGEKLSFDRTLNHQNFFAGCGSYLTDYNDKIARRVRRFLDNLSTTLRIHDDGLIKHFARPSLLQMILSMRALRHKNLPWNEVVSHWYSRSSDHRRKEVGYHPVTLSGLCPLKRAFPDHSFWNHSKYRDTLAYIESGTWKEERNQTGTDFGALVPEFVLARVNSTLRSCDEAELVSLIERGIGRYYDFDSNTLTKNTTDPAYQAAQIKHLIDFSNLEIQLEAGSGSQ